MSDSARRSLTPLGLVGNTPVVRIDWSNTEVRSGFWAKLEGCNPGGIKDRAAIHMIQSARDRGDLAPGGTIVESSSGTLALGLALVGICLGHPVIVASEAKLEPIIQRLLLAYGVQLSIVTDPDPTGGWVVARRQRAQELVARIPGAWWPNQYDNLDNADSYERLAEELLQQFNHIDVVVCSVGTGGHSAGITRRLRREWPHLQLVGVDAVGSVIFGQPSNRGVMRGLGNTIFPRNVSYELFNEVHWVNAGEAVHVCRELARTGYVTGGWSVGCVALVASWAACVRPQECVVAIFPDGPLRYWNTVYDDEFCRLHGCLGVRPAGRPDEIGHPQERQVTRWTRCGVIINPTGR